MRTIKDADKIFLFENGHLQARAPMQSVKSNDSFKAMVAYQSLN